MPLGKFFNLLDKSADGFQGWRGNVYLGKGRASLARRPIAQPENNFVPRGQPTHFFPMLLSSLLPSGFGLEVKVREDGWRKRGGEYLARFLG